MGLFRLIFRVLFSSKPPVRRRKIQEERRTHGASSRQSAQQGHRVTIQGRCYVIDGDTIVIGDAHIRLAGIDAPELDHPYGKNAKWTLVNLCKGQTIQAVLEPDISYDRTVATCYLPDGRDLSAEMVKRGMAIDWTKFSGGKYRQFEPPEARRILWRCVARQQGRMPPAATR